MDEAAADERGGGESSLLITKSLMDILFLTDGQKVQEGGREIFKEEEGCISFRQLV